MTVKVHSKSLRECSQQKIDHKYIHERKNLLCDITFESSLHVKLIKRVDTLFHLFVSIMLVHEVLKCSIIQFISYTRNKIPMKY